jgi:hypothetical protein
VDVEDQLAGGNRSASPLLRTNRGKDFAFIESVEITPFKGLDLKPMYSYFHADGLTAGAARRNASNIRTIGGAMNVAAAVGGGAPAGDATDHENRHTVGLDARWRLGPFGLDPTVSYQWGSYETQAQRTNGTIGKVKGDASAWLFDVIGSFQLGPLLLEGRGIYSTGNKARDNLSLSKRYYEPLDTDTGIWSGGWLGILALGIDYFNGGGGANQGMATNVGYDRYGRAQFALRATYSITPALSVYGVVAPTWAAEKVDTDTGCPALTVGTSATGCTARIAVSGKSFVEGDSRYIGTEVNGGITWRFAPNTAFDLAGYYLAAGPALKMSEFLNGEPVKRDQHDGYYAVARVRLSF